MSKYQALWEYVREKEILIVTLLFMGINVFIRPISVKIRRNVVWQDRSAGRIWLAVFIYDLISYMIRFYKDSMSCSNKPLFQRKEFLCLSMSA